jgi:hypothetical protein
VLVCSARVLVGSAGELIGFAGVLVCSAGVLVGSAGELNGFAGVLVGSVGDLVGSAGELNGSARVLVDTVGQSDSKACGSYSKACRFRGSLFAMIFKESKCYISTKTCFHRDLVGCFAL